MYCDYLCPIQPKNVIFLKMSFCLNNGTNKSRGYLKGPMGASCKIGNTSCESDVPRSHFSPLHCFSNSKKTQFNSTGEQYLYYTLIIPLHFLEVALGISIPFHQKEIFFLSFSGHFPFFIHTLWTVLVD